MKVDDYDDIRRYESQQSKRRISVIAITLIFLIAVFLITLMIGNYKVSVSEIFEILLGGGSAEARDVVMNIRLPRLLCCLLVGAALSVSGLTMQSLFKNPMASPSVLGISSGASFGASIAISFGVAGFLGAYSTSFMAFIFCFVTMGLVYMIARTRYGVATVTLLLAGVAVGAFFNGLVSLMQYIADDDTLASIVYWMMGSFNKCGWDEVYLAAIPIVIGLCLIVLHFRELNMISAGEEQAANMGVNVKKVRLLLILGTSLCVGGSVAIAGTIGFVGLIVPHIFRMLVGPNHKLLLPLCILGGAAFMAIMDTISKSAFSVSISVGILTSLLGAPFFIYILKTRKKELWE